VSATSPSVSNAVANAAPGTRLVLVATILVLLTLVATYAADWAAMAAIWRDSDTFAHGMLIAPIAAWLAWRRRAVLACLAPRPWPIALAALALAGFGWLFAHLASVNAATQFSLVAMAVAAAVAVAGRAVARELAFPLAFLFLMVPAGEFLVPTMMRHTADFTVWAVAASGVPVYREGLHFVLPTGRWSVVEACSGLRYLIASFVLGTLYAYLNFRSLPRRLLFVAASVVVPVVANWLRAYGIVMLGHLSGMELAVGADHLVYGWVFFGLVMFLLFWIGSRWRDDAPAEPSPALDARAGSTAPHSSSSASNASRAIVVATLAALVIATGWRPLAATLLDRTVPATDFGARIDRAWPDASAERAPLGLRPAFDGAREQRLVAVPGEVPVGVYAGYYARQHESGEMIRHGNTLVTSGDASWHPVSTGSARLEGGADVTRTELASDAGGRLLVYHWYTVDGRHTAADAKAKLLTAAAVLSGAGDGSSANAVWARLDGGAPAEAVESVVRERASRLAEAVAGARHAAHER
jgi:exosortase A